MLQCRCKYLLYITIFLHQHVFCQSAWIQPLSDLNLVVAKCMIKGHNVHFCKENCLVVLHPELHECTISYQWVWILWFCSGFSSVFLLCCPVVSLALTSYSLCLDYMSQKWIKLDVSRTEIRLNPSIYFRMEGIHVNMSCLSILQYLFHLSVVACFIIKAHARGRRLC